jgi:hypothetical protein
MGLVLVKINMTFSLGTAADGLHTRQGKIGSVILFFARQGKDWNWFEVKKDLHSRIVGYLVNIILAQRAESLAVFVCL